MAQTKSATQRGKGRASTKTKNSSKASPKAKTSVAKGHTKSGAKSSSEKSVTIDRRRGSRRDEARTDEANSPVVMAPKLERRQKVNRRRQIDPTTCERDYTDEEIQFMNALDDYKRANGRMFPTCSEVLEVVRSLGYVRVSPAKVAVYEATTVTFAADEEAANEYQIDRQASP